MNNGADTWRTAALVLASFVVGLALPDADQLLPLQHRSALTHSVLPVLVTMLHPERARLATGLALGIGVHLSADSFPNAMIGYATVKLPFVGSMGVLWSYVWLGIHALSALILGTALAFKILPHRWALAIMAAIAMGSAAYLFATDGGWPALALFMLTGAAGWRLRRRQ